MAYRAFDVKVVRVDAQSHRLVIQRNKVEKNETKHLKTIFKVDPYAVITDKDSCFLALSDIKVNDRLILDFIKTEDEKLFVKGISVLS